MTRIVKHQKCIWLLLASIGAVPVQAQTFTVLYSFGGGADGQSPFAGLVQDPAGNLYGTTAYGGIGFGVFFKVDMAGKETVLHTFTGQDGRKPYTGVIRDEEGNFYGTTEMGGVGSTLQGGYGTVFKLDAAGTETMLYTFTGGTETQPDGDHPEAGLVR